jgi:hypothetical protein
MSETTQIQPQRPMRADARRNYDALVTAARERFAASYLVAPLSHLAENLVRIGKEKFFSDEGSAQVPAPNGNRL